VRGAEPGPFLQVITYTSAMATALVEQNELASAMARFFRVLGDPTRLKIIELLLQREHSVTELAEATGLSQSRISNHLACLRWCKFVETERQSRRILYRVADPGIRTLLNEVGQLSREHCEHLASCRRIGPDWM